MGTNGNASERPEVPPGAIAVEVIAVAMGRDEDGTPRARMFTREGIVVELEAQVSGDEWTFTFSSAEDGFGTTVVISEITTTLTLDELLYLARSLVTGA
jgi:fibronectin type 3 domain-containing protein